MPPAVSAETGDLLVTMRVMRAELADLRQQIFGLRGPMAVPAPAE
jgi:hypothetical protein